MKVTSYKVNMTTAFTDAQLIKSGWKAEEKDKLYSREKGKYKFSYIIKSFGKIRISEIKCQLDFEQQTKLQDIPEFDFAEGWSSLWNKSFTPESVEILMKENIFNNLLELEWKPAVLGVIEYIQDQNNLSYYYPAPEGEGLYKLVDENPQDVMKFISKLESLGIS